jgi:hypothetical protein
MVFGHHFLIIQFLAVLNFFCQEFEVGGQLADLLLSQISQICYFKLTQSRRHGQAGRLFIDKDEWAKFSGCSRDQPNGTCYVLQHVIPAHPRASSRKLT